MKYFYLAVLLCFGYVSLNTSSSSSNITSHQSFDSEKISNLSIRWWQWVINAPDGFDPLADDMGDSCTYGQVGDVFFLASSYSFDKVVRNCHIPKNKYIFFPVISTMRWDINDDVTCEDLQQEVKAAIDNAGDMLAELDGQKLSPIRAATKICFSIPGDGDFYASDGYWVLLKPLSQGEHIVHFKGLIEDKNATQDEYRQDIEYKLNIK